jgi:subtilisin-like proprotein convertase family protein
MNANIIVTTLENETAATQKRIETVPLRAATKVHNTMKILKAKILLVLLAAVSPLLLQAQTIESYTFTTNRLVPDGNAAGLSDVRNVNSAIGTITSLKVNLKLTGEFNGDLYGYVRHSSGFTVLLNRSGTTSGTATGYADSGFDVTFQTGAVNGDVHLYQATTTPDAGLPLTGIWEPDGRTNDPVNVTDASSRATSLTNFNGLDAAGEWTLYLADVESGGTNQLTEWALEITGSASPTLTWTNPASLTYGTPLSGTQLNATATYNSTNVPGTLTYSSPSGTYLNAGSGQTLTVTFTPNDPDGFLPVTNSVTIDVLQAPLNITALDQSKLYGAELPTLTASYSGFVNGDDESGLGTAVTLGTTATAASTIGTYPITASAAVGTNYAISYVAGTLSVTTAPLNITAVDQSKLYGAELPMLTASYSGFVNGDDASSLGTAVTLGTTATAVSTIGTYPITASAAVGTNYSISYVAGTLSVTTAPLNITAVDQSKLYGAELPTLTASYSGFVNGDDASSLGTAVTLSTTATAASTIGTYPITASAAVGTNYSISYVAGTLTVSTAPLSITADDKSKLYGAELPTLTASYSGFVNGDDASDLGTAVTLSTTATASSTIGTYPITASAAVGTNYSISYVAGTLTITPAPLNITANDTNKVYGAALPMFTANYSGFVNGDDESDFGTAVTLATTATASSPAGNYIITASDAVGTNYAISFESGTLTIGTAVLTITANDQTKAFGEALPAFTASYSGFVNDDDTNNLITLASVTTTAIASSDVGTYPITASGAVSTNYAFSYVGGSLTITQSLSSGAIVSSANPALPGTDVTFTLTLSAVTPGVGIPTGTVNFRIDGNILGSGTVSGGAATFMRNNLAHGAHTVVAEYAGDLNFGGSTNALTPDQVINAIPIAGNDTIERYPTQGVKVQLATLLANDSDTDNDALNITVSATSASNATITVSGGWVYYTPAADFTNADSFTYTITDGQGGSTNGNVTVAIKVDDAPGVNLTLTDLGKGSFLIRGDGIPGRTYRMQYSDTIVPFDWQIISGGTVTADSVGVFNYTDTSGSSSRYYRSVYP